MIFKKIKDYFKKRKQNRQIISTLSYGDIIWCNVKNYKHIKFKKNHTTRPYFVVEVTKNRIKCIPFTHKVNNSFFCFFVNKNYGSMILSNGIFSLKFNHFEKLNKKDKLTEFELSKITKRLFIYYNSSKEYSVFSKYIKYRPNDIVVVDGRYYILFNIIDDKYTLYEFSKYYKTSYVKVDVSFYVKTTPVIVDDVNSLTYFNTFKDDKVRILSIYIKDKKEKEKKRKSKNDKRQTLSTVEVGTLIKYDNKNYFYIGSKDNKGCLVEQNFASSTWVNDDVDVRRLETTTSDELCYLKNRFFQ